jgi:FkbM family methyltransferase
MSLLFSGFVGPSGQVIAIEADGYVFHVLKTNVQLNGRENISPLHAAAYFADEMEVEFPDHDFSTFSTYGSFGLRPESTSAGGAGAQTVKTLRIDSLAIERKVSFMKVDVQGCDLFAMQGAVEAIKRHRMPILFEFEEEFQSGFGTTFQDYVDFVSSIGYVFKKTVNRINYLVVPRGEG